MWRLLPRGSLGLKTATCSGQIAQGFFHAERRIREQAPEPAFGGDGLEHAVGGFRRVRELADLQSTLRVKKVDPDEGEGCGQAPGQFDHLVKGCGFLNLRAGG